MNSKLYEKIIVTNNEKIKVIGFIDLKCNKYWNKNVLEKK